MGLFSFFKRNKDKEKEKKFKMGLHKTREGALKNISMLLKKNNKIDDELFDSLEEVFISSDIGVNTVVEFVDELKEEVKNKKLENVSDLEELIIDRMFLLYTKDEIVNANLMLNKEGLSTILFVGVNGVGKTTSIAKVANMYKKEGKKVLLAAGDTFRAGAIEQLKEWANRLKIDIVTKNSGDDPASVIYEAMTKALNEKYDILLCDTAGRLQNKVNLMNELAKIKKVIVNKDPNALTETLLVIDATTGQNGMQQAKGFKECTDITGVVLTKLDSTSKGGIVLAIRNEMNIPIKFVGLGEKLEDLEVFDIESYLYGLFADFFEGKDE